MKAIIYRRYGPINEVVEEVDSYPRACISLTGNQVLIKIVAASLSQRDYKLMQGKLALTLFSGPKVRKGGKIPGCSVSGIVTAVGNKVKSLRQGDEVIGMLPDGGGLAEFAAANEKCFVLKPPNLTHMYSASLSYCGVAAFQALRYQADLQPNERILILNGSGGLGSLAVQIAKCMKAIVTATTSKNEKMLDHIGADFVFNYTQGPWWEEFQGSEFDVILNCGDGDSHCWLHCPLVLKPKTGRYITFVPDEDNKVTIKAYVSNMLWRKVRTPFSSLPRYKTCKVEINHRNLLSIAKLAKKGRLKPVVDASSPFAFSENGAKNMLLKLGAKEASGKLVMAIDPVLAQKISPSVKPKHCISGKKDVKGSSSPAQGRAFASPTSTGSHNSSSSTLFSPISSTDERRANAGLKMGFNKISNSVREGTRRFSGKIRAKIRRKPDGEMINAPQF